MTKESECLVLLHGEQYRKIIENAMVFLNKHEPLMN
jgi:hypothetical protein